MNCPPGLAAALARLRPGQRVCVAGCAGEPAGFLDTLAADPERARGLTVKGIFLPGVNGRDASGFGAGIRVETFFMTPALAALLSCVFRLQPPMAAYRLASRLISRR